MLLTDRVPIGQADLGTFDKEVLKHAREGNVDVTDAIEVAMSECIAKLETLRRSLGLISGPMSSTAAHINAVFDLDGSNTIYSTGNADEWSLSHIVIDSEAGRWGAFDMWLIWQSIYVVYRTLATGNSAELFGQKQVNASAQAGLRYSELTGAGLRSVNRYLSAPGAMFVRNAGTFGDSSVSIVEATASRPEGDLPVGVCITYQSDSVESAPSATISRLLRANENIQVTIAALNPFANQQDFTALQPTHWNVYASTGGMARRQNPAPIPIATQSFEIADLLTDSAILGRGQIADGRLLFNTTWLRS